MYFIMNDITSYCSEYFFLDCRKKSHSEKYALGIFSIELRAEE